jgi:hypothetical protein
MVVALSPLFPFTLPGRLDSLAVDRQSDDEEVFAPEPGLQSIKGRHLLAARHAPRRPNIQQDHPASEIGERQVMALVILNAQLGDRARLLKHE